jgi:hypothetical protein
MGFKSIHAFNLAMLGKQGWRLLTCPNNLISRLFKVRYFPRSNFLGVGHNPSYVWRSIWSTKALIREGSRWCIGDGSSISICAENWLGDGTQIPQFTNDATILSHMRVSNLLHETSKSWNIPLIQNLFQDHIAIKILNTSLFTSVCEDRRIWKVEKNGDYSVRSAYRFCIIDFIDTSSFRAAGSWNLIWRIKAPPKIKKSGVASMYCLPTRNRLQE